MCKHEKINTRTYGGGEKYCEFMSFDGVKGCNEKFCEVVDFDGVKGQIVWVLKVMLGLQLCKIKEAMSC